MEKLLKDLKPHPLNAEIYGSGVDPQLVESIKEHGILEPLVIDRSDRIISGHRRYEAAKLAGLNTVPVTVLKLTDEADIIMALIEANRQRTKTNEQEAREAACLFQVESEKASLRRAKGNSKTDDPAISPEEIGDAREIVARKLKMGAKRVQQAVAVIETMDNLRKQGNTADADWIRDVLNRQSINGANTLILAKGLSGGTAKVTMADDQSAILIKEWQNMSAEQKQAELTKPWPESRFTPQTCDAREWAQWAWHPVTGCLHGCEYCEARDVALQRYPHGFEPTFYPNRLNATAVTPLPKKISEVGNNVLACPTADLFGKWVPKDVIEAVLDAVRRAPMWNFLFLTKNPQRLLEFGFPQNAWVGVTVNTQKRVNEAEAVFRQLSATVKWLACEPLLEPLTFSQLNLFQWLLIGGANKSSQTGTFRPRRQWVEDLWKQADDCGCGIFEEPNLLERRRDFPRPIETDKDDDDGDKHHPQLME
jgi:ParB-like chromosome segregation protein Spo0J/protein gp37